MITTARPSGYILPMPPNLPPWLPLDPSPPGREAVVDAICRRLGAPGTLAVVTGEPGVGVTTVLGAIAARLSAQVPVQAVRLAGSLDGHHIIHLVGQALGASFPGDQAAVGESLKEAGPILLIMDDADVPDLATLLERLQAVAPEARFLVAGRRVTLHQPSIHLDGLPPEVFSRIFPGLDAGLYQGNPLLGRLVHEGGASPEDPWSLLDDLPPEVSALAACQGGIPGPRPVHVPDLFFLPVEEGMCTLRRAVAERIFARHPPSPEIVTLILHERLDEILAMGRGAVLDDHPDPRVLPALDYLANHHADPLEAALARSALARIRVMIGQAGLVRTERAARADTSAPQDDRILGLLAWVEGDALLADGEVRDAQAAWEVASTRLRRAQWTEVLGALHRRCGELLVSRGEFQTAKDHFRDAIGLLRIQGKPRALAMCMVGAATAWQAQGQWMHADSLLEQAGALLTSVQAPASDRGDLLLAQATLAMERGSWDAGRLLLDEVAAITGLPNLCRANLARRRADLCIGTGQHPEAGRHLDEACTLYAGAGERAALANAVRLQGDLAAIRGDPARADTCYSRAVREHARAGDLRALARTLAHRALLEEELGDKETANAWRRVHGEILQLVAD